MTGLSIRGLVKSFGATRALGCVDLDIAACELFVILGPTNAGKSTLLKSVAGLVPTAVSLAVPRHLGSQLAWEARLFWFTPCGESNS